MKKVLILMIAAILLMSSCSTYTAEGVYVGSSAGALFGTVIGGMAGGGRGADLGAVVGMASGAAVGAAIGQAAEDRARAREAQDIHDHYMHVQANKARGINPYNKVVNRKTIDDMYVTPSSTTEVVIDDSGSSDDTFIFEK